MGIRQVVFPQVRLAETMGFSASSEVLGIVLFVNVLSKHQTIPSFPTTVYYVYNIYNTGYCECFCLPFFHLWLVTGHSQCFWLCTLQLLCMRVYSE